MAKRVINNPGAARRKLRKAKAVIETRAKKEFTFRGFSLEAVSYTHLTLPTTERV